MEMVAKQVVNMEGEVVELAKVLEPSIEELKPMVTTSESPVNEVVRLVMPDVLLVSSVR